MSDLIERHAAIDALCSVCGVDCDKSKFVYDGKQEEQVILCPEHYALTQLPSAQPEKVWIANKTLSEEQLREAVEKAKESLKNSIIVTEPERKRGKWIDRNGNIVAPFWERYECSECGARSDNSNFCPNCGAKMVEPQESEG